MALRGNLVDTDLKRSEARHTCRWLKNKTSMCSLQAQDSPPRLWYWSHRSWVWALARLKRSPWLWAPSNTRSTNKSQTIMSYLQRTPTRSAWPGGLPPPRAACNRPFGAACRIWQYWENNVTSLIRFTQSSCMFGASTCVLSPRSAWCSRSHLYRELPRNSAGAQGGRRRWLPDRSWRRWPGQFCFFAAVQKENLRLEPRTCRTNEKISRNTCWYGVEMEFTNPGH